jgi:hypothetical protein
MRVQSWAIIYLRSFLRPGLSSGPFLLVTSAARVRAPQRGALASLTYDIHDMPVNGLMKLLPEEFGTRWR